MTFVSFPRRRSRQRFTDTPKAGISPMTKNGAAGEGDLSFFGWM
jgi:hypothetical protein